MSEPKPFNHVRSMSQHSRRSHVRRANVTACVRCKSRKQRCDQKIPACSNCERASVECVSHDIDGSVVSRSYLKSLEDHVAHLEQELQSCRAQIPGNVPGTVRAPENTEQVLAQAAFVSLHPSTFPSPRYLGTGSALPLLRLLIAELDSLGSIKTSIPASTTESTIADLLPHELIVELPTNDVCVRLIETYLEHSNFFSPIFYRADVLDMLNTARDQSNPMIRFKIFAILAIAVQLLNRTDSSIPVSKADAFFSAASQILLSHSNHLLTGDLEHLEILLLIIQYSAFSTSLLGTWHIIGLATRLTLDLGLHDEPSLQSPVDALAADRRRRLFWATYTFERNLCAVLGRPVSIPDEAIFVSLPASVDEEYITPSGILPQVGPSRIALAVHLIRFRQLESELMQVLHQKPPLALSSFSHHSWRINMRQRLYEWRGTVPFHDNPTQLAPLEIFDGNLYNSLLQLYSPSRHMPSPTGDELVFLTECAQKSIEAYRSCFRDGKLRFYWRTVHSLFRSGVALIYCLSNWPLEQTLNSASVHASINTCSSVLWAMVERYPAGKACRDIFESLHDLVRQSEHGVRIPDDVFPNLFSLTPTSYHTPEGLFSLVPPDFTLPSLGMPDLYS